MPAPRNDMYYALDYVLCKARYNSSSRSTRDEWRDKILSQRRGFSHSVHHPQVLQYMTIHVVAEEYNDFIVEHLRDSRHRLAVVTLEGASHGLFQADKDFFFTPGAAFQFESDHELNQFLSTRLKLSVQLLNLLIPENNSNQQLYCPRVLRLQKLASSSREAAARNELEKLKNRILRAMRFLSNHLVGFYFCLPEGKECWDQILQYDGFLTTLSLLCQFNIFSPTCLKTYNADESWDYQHPRLTCNHNDVVQCYSYGYLWPGTLLARAVAYTSLRLHFNHPHATRCLLMAVFNRRGLKKEPCFQSAYELLCRSSLDNDFCPSAWLRSAEADEFESYLNKFDKVSSLSAVEVLALRVVYTMTVHNDSDDRKCLATEKVIANLGGKIDIIWRNCRRITANTNLVPTCRATEDGRCECRDKITLYAWLLWAVTRICESSVQLLEWTTRNFVPSVCYFVEHILQHDLFSTVAAVALLRFLIDMITMFPQLATQICEVDGESAISALVKCFGWSESMRVLAVQLASILFNTPHHHDFNASHPQTHTSKCIVTDPQLKNQLNPALLAAVGISQKIGNTSS
ncbi:hypothetical protein FHG87_009336 [Trinorchestia longiramus]|nr:hypothetical protein FHG87_009336 [Trinorchestia longiramus]